MSTLVQLSRKLKFSFLLFFCATFIYQLFRQLPLYVFNVWMYAKIIEAFERGFLLSEVIPIVLGIVLFMITSNIYSSFYEYIIKPVFWEKLNLANLSELTKRSQFFSWGELEDSKFRNDFLFYAENIEEIITGFIECTTNLFASIIVIFLTGSLIFNTDPILLVLLLLSLISTFIGNKKVGILESEKEVKQLSTSKQLDYFLRVFLDVKAIREIRLNQLSYLLKQKLTEAVGAYSKQQKKESKRIFISRFLFNFLLSDTFLKIIGPLFLLVKLFVRRTITLSSFVATYNAFNMMFQSLSSVLGSELTAFFFNKKRLSNLNVFIGKHSEKSANAFMINQASSNYMIQLADFYFKYPKEEKYALKNVNLTISAGEKVLIVGKNGSGKSTLLKVMMNQYKLNSKNHLGDIRYNPELQFKDFNYQSQHFQMYPLSLGTNMTLKRDFSQTQVFKLIDKVNLDPMLKGAIDQPIGRNLFWDGIELSGGETQKVVLARSLSAEEKQILFFDEPLSQVDARMDNFFSLALQEEFKEQTVIVISHSLEYADNFEKIILMKDGRIDSVGTHEQLLNTSILYQELNS